MNWHRLSGASSTGFSPLFAILASPIVISESQVAGSATSFYGKSATTLISLSTTCWEVNLSTKSGTTCCLQENKSKVSLLFHGTTTNVNSILKLFVFNFWTWIFFFFWGYILGFREMGFVEFQYWQVNMVFKLCSKFLYLIVFWLYFGVSWNGFLEFH